MIPSFTHLVHQLLQGHYCCFLMHQRATVSHTFYSFAIIAGHLLQLLLGDYVELILGCCFRLVAFFTVLIEDVCMVVGSSHLHPIDYLIETIIVVVGC